MATFLALSPRLFFSSRNFKKQKLLIAAHGADTLFLSSAHSGRIHMTIKKTIQRMLCELVKYHSSIFQI